MHRLAAALVALVAALVATVLAPVPATAQSGPGSAGRDSGDQPFQITADSVDYERGREVYVARGNVHIVQDERSLVADWVSFSPNSGRGVASGNVVFSDGKETIYASFAEFGVESLQGVMFLARFEAATGQFRMEGDEVVKTGDQTYTFENGTFTTCKCPDDGPEPWRITTESADVDLEGYAVARNTTVNILGVPLLWLPWLIYPVKTERETGLLFPEFGVDSRSGIMIGVPFFWAARKNLNVTVTPRWLEKRGAKGDATVEYVLGEKSSGRVFGAYIYDMDINPDSPSDPFDRNRWGVVSLQDIHLPADWRFKADVKAMSDNRYSSDFRDELQQFSRDRFLISTGFLTREFGETGSYGLVGGSVIGDDVQSPDDQDRDPWMLQRMANLEFAALPQRFPWFEYVVPSTNATYTWFGQWQNPNDIFRGPTVGDDLFYDVGSDAESDRLERFFTATTGTDPHGDNFVGNGNDFRTQSNGEFDDGEPLADRGQRLLLHPKLAVPWRFGNYFELYPEVGYRSSVFQSRAQNLQNWGAITGRADVRTRLHKELGNGLVHIIEPRVGYAIIEVPDIDGDPMFVPRTNRPQTRLRELDLDNVTRDDADRIDDFNGITWGVANRFYRRATEDRPAELVADISVTGQYDFADGGHLGNFSVDGVARPFDGVRARIATGLDPNKFRMDEFWGEVLWEGRRISLGLRYRYLRDIPLIFDNYTFEDDRFDDAKNGFDSISEATMRLGYKFTERWSARWQINYSFETKILLQNQVGVEYISNCECWAAGVTAAQDRQFGFSFGVLYRIVGLGKDPGGLQQGLLDGF